MLLIDTSVWVSVFCDRTGQIHQKLETLINERDVFLTRFTLLELLEGSLNEQEIESISISIKFMEQQPVFELANEISVLLSPQFLHLDPKHLRSEIVAQSKSLIACH